MKKYNVGYTSGVFDLFHVGHLNIIKKAYEICDFLIVGVTSDEEVIKIKARATFIPFEERVEIIKALKYVHKVVEETDTDKFLAWQKYKFNVIVKGDDWKGTTKWKEYEEKFSTMNVDIKFFPYTKAISTTRLREAINNEILESGV